MAKRKSRGNGQVVAEETDRIQYVSLSDETRRRYLNYALSVITSRALPDVRDGLKPVQRRLLYAMYHDLRLTADSKPRKCQKIAGDTTGNYHPHGDVAVYDALVRLAQDFSLRYPLVDGQGNFGSVMGLPAAAARYTEARLTALAEELMQELRYQTVEMRPNYEATRDEPVVLPARFPNILVNGVQGIAVGMATSIPPHNLAETLRACIHLIDHPEASTAQLMRFIKGPDFPLGGRIVMDRRELRKAYEQGRGSIKVRGEWEFDRRGRKRLANRLVITSVPYGVETGPLLAEISTLVSTRRLPQLLSAADESDAESGLRLVLEIKPGSDAEAVMAYLYKHTNLETNITYNATCLVPDEHGVLVPARLSLVEILRHFLDFRLATVRRRFEYQLRQLEARIHLLEGFAIVFDGLDKALRIIRRSRGKQDAAAKLRKAFPLDDVQASAILDLALYRISQLEIERILEELEEKKAEAQRIRKILASQRRLWSIVKKEFEELRQRYGDKRRTNLGSADEVTELDPEAYIVRENTNVVVTRDGWIKRVGRLQKVESTRVREGDSVLDVVPASTLDRVIFLASDGTAYTLPVDRIPASSGYGDPLAKHVRLSDGASVVAAITTDPRFTPEDFRVRGEPVPGPFLLVATARGQVLRFPLSPLRAVSTRAGRRYCRLSAGDRVVFAQLIGDAKTVFLATRQARVLHFAIRDVPVLAGPGKGVRGIKLEPGDEVLGAVPLSRPSDAMHVRNSNGKVLAFGQTKYGVTSRGGKGIRTSQRNGFEEVVRPPIELVDWNAIEAD